MQGIQFLQFRNLCEREAVGMKSRWFAKAAAVVCAVCLAVGVMSQTVFARDGSVALDGYAAQAPEATFVILDGTSTADTLPVTDNRQSVPLYSGGVQVGECAIVNGEPYMGVEAFCRALGLNAQTIDNGNAVSLAMDGLLLLAQMGQPYFSCNERYLYMPNGPRTVNGAVALPVEALVKCMGLTACWDRAQWTITVDDTAVTPLVAGSEYYDEADIYWLSRLIFSMAGDEPLDAKVAVGDVCVNRLESDDFAGQSNIYEVVFAKNQFDVVTNGMIYLQPDEESVLAAKMALEEDCDLTHGAAYVAAADMGSGYECVARLGSLQFFTAA